MNISLALTCHTCLTGAPRVFGEYYSAPMSWLWNRLGGGGQPTLFPPPGTGQQVGFG